MLGMWVFLLTEVLFFGGLFMAYILYRSWYPEAFHEASRHLSVGWGFFNTLVLIASSLTMALAVRAGQTTNRRGQLLFLTLTIVLGAAFLGVKVIEYGDKFAHHLVPGPDFQFTPAELAPAAEIYFSLYFAMTGLHALHMIVGAGIMLVMLYMAWRGRFSTEWYTPLEVSGLYWHFVDIVWIFLFPLLYLIGGLSVFGGGTGH
ncbi:MAG: cytochrome c oxidase subunit 3 family protein [Luteitalea sp.]|nr:cytochrome c oxidase subunit 3 family protein [Luteitalea sp.]